MPISWPNIMTNILWKIGGGYLLKCVINLVPIYWFGLTIYMISSLLLGIDLKCGMINIISHYLLLNGLLPQWFGGFMGGTGYFGILILMWILFPIYLKRIKNLTDSVLYGIIAIACSLTIMVILRGLNAALGFDNSGNFDDWVWYLNRGIYSYALGGVLYYWLKEKEVVLSTRLAKVVGYALLIIIIVKAVLYGSKFDGIFFLALWIGFVILGHKVKFFLVDNSLFAWLGKHITELFVAHIVLYYLLVLNYRIVQPGYKTMLILFALSFSTAPLLKKFITEPFKSLNMKLIHFRED